MDSLDPLFKVLFKPISIFYRIRVLEGVPSGGFREPGRSKGEIGFVWALLVSPVKEAFLNFGQ